MDAQPKPVGMLRRLLIVVALLALLAPATAGADAGDLLQAEVTRTNSWIDTGQIPVYRIYPTSSPCTKRIYTNPFFAALDARWTAVPTPCSFSPGKGPDYSAAILDYRDGKVYETWKTKYNDPAFPFKLSARWGGGDVLPPVTSQVRAWPRPGGVAYGTQASGLAFVPGILTIADFKRGYADHEVAVVTPEVCATWRAPATRTDGTPDGPGRCFEYGTRLKLPASYNVEALPNALQRMLGRSFQRHGAIITDRTHYNVGVRAESPANKAILVDGKNPYWRAGGYFGCTTDRNLDTDSLNDEYGCYPNKNNKLRSFPWGELVEVN